MKNSKGSPKCPECVTKDMKVENLERELDLTRQRVKLLENDCQQPKKRIQLTLGHGVDDDKDQIINLGDKLPVLKQQAEALVDLVQDESQMMTIIEHMKSVLDMEIADNHPQPLIHLDHPNIFPVSSSTVQKSPLENPLIIGKITKHLDLNNVLKSRLVNSVWNNVAYITARKFHLFDNIFSFIYNEKKNCYVNCTLRSRLEDFNQVFKNSHKLPITSFQFLEGSLSTPDMKLFLSIYGQQIIQLEIVLNISSSDLTLGTLSKLLCHDLPNLETLSFGDTPEEWNKTGGHLFPEPNGHVQLPELTKIVVCGDIHPQVLSDILRVAVNLKKIERIDFANLPSVVSVNKLDYITDMMMNPRGNEEGLKLCQELVQSKFQPTKLFCFLLSLTLLNSFEGFEDIVQKIFESHTEKLDSLEFGPLNFLPNLRLPIFNKVKTIVFIGFGRRKENRMLPLGQYFHQIFPNVVHVHFRMNHLKLNEIFLDSLFLSGQQILSVKNLDFISPTQEDSAGIAKLVPFFPNLTTLAMTDLTFKDVPILCNLIWKLFSNIENLDLSWKFQQPTEQLSLEIDSAFTGFSIETCKDLRMNSRNVSVEDAQNLRENPSILNMTKLKFLTINFEDVQDLIELEEDIQKWPLFSHVGRVYGFQAIKLQQNCTLKLTSSPAEANEISQLKLALEPILSYVDEVKFPLIFSELLFE